MHTFWAVSFTASVIVRIAIGVAWIERVATIVPRGAMVDNVVLSMLVRVLGAVVNGGL